MSTVFNVVFILVKRRGYQGDWIERAHCGVVVKSHKPKRERPFSITGPGRGLEIRPKLS
jgi:hypothetical protein